MANDNTVLSRENYICSYILSWSSMQNMVMSFISFIKNNFIDMANDNTVHTFRPDTRWRIWWWVLFHLLKIILLIWQTTTQFSPERTIFVHTFRPDPRWRIWRVRFMLNFIKINWNINNGAPACEFISRA